MRSTECHQGSDARPGRVHVALFSRRLLLGTSGAAAIAPLAAGLIGPTSHAAAAPSVTGPLVVLRSTPSGCSTSRSTPPSLGGGKLSTGNSVAVTVVTDLPSNQIISAAFLNCTITDTEGIGYPVIRPSDLSGEVPLPPTSNVNWSTSGQILANLVLTAIGGENAVEVHATARADACTSSSTFRATSRSRSSCTGVSMVDRVDAAVLGDRLRSSSGRRRRNDADVRSGRP